MKHSLGSLYWQGSAGGQVKTRNSNFLSKPFRKRFVEIPYLSYIHNMYKMSFFVEIPYHDRVTLKMLYFDAVVTQYLWEMVLLIKVIQATSNFVESLLLFLKIRNWIGRMRNFTFNFHPNSITWSVRGRPRTEQRFQFPF